MIIFIKDWKKMLRIATIDGHKRMSTQELLQKISRSLEEGETDFHISASGQHDIGGPCWNAKGKPLRFVVSNPGQRVGSMCLPGTEVIVEGPAPADVGWLNSGGQVIVKGDAGDTAGHCAAGGIIYIGGRAGTRSGSLMKRDPLCEAPELWVLESVGSFSFEFMGGGCAVVCGHDSQTLPSVLGQRPCVGMVGGTVYFRGPCGDLPPDVSLLPLEEDDIAWLDKGLENFLTAIGKTGLRKELSIWRHWRKLVPAKRDQAAKRTTMREFHEKSWLPNGVFGDILADDGGTEPLCAAGRQRLREPLWHNGQMNCVDCRQCLEHCPRTAVKRREVGENIDYSVVAAKCIGCGICAAVCPNDVWQMRLVTMESVMR